MKTKLFLSGFMIFSALFLHAQFITKPLNFPNNLSGVYTFSILDQNHTWLGTDRIDWQNMVLYSFPFAVHTNDGGDIWQFDSIPATGTKIAVQEVSAVDSNTCYYAVTDNDVTFWIYKTTDGGVSWTNTTTTQFVGGFIDFVHAYNADSVVAAGDPTAGYWEIQQTIDGGTSWTRVPAANIPAKLSNEFSNWMYHSFRGNTIWFATSRGRCYKSVDRGYNWTVSQAIITTNYCDVKFSSDLNGVFFSPDVNNTLRTTTDGGVTWTPLTLTGIPKIHAISPVEGFPEGFIFTSPGTSTGKVNVFFTPDLFNAVLLITPNLASTGYLSFLNTTIGWVSGPESLTNNIYKYNDVLTGISTAANQAEKLSITPNPSTANALIHLPKTALSATGKIYIYDISGKLTETINTEAARQWVAVDAAKYKNGIYLVKYINSKGIPVSQRWIIQH